MDHLQSLLRWLAAFGADARAYSGSLTILITALAVLALAPIVYVALVYFFDMRGKDTTDV